MDGDLEVSEIKQEIDWIEKALTEPNSVEHRIYLSSAPKKDLITRWANNLEKLHEAGEFHQDINTISSYISNKFRKWNMPSAVHYVRHVLDHKYTNSAYDRTEDGGQENHKISSKDETKEILAFEAKQTNTILLSHLVRTKAVIQNIIERLRRDVLLESKIPENELDALYVNWSHILQRTVEAWDGREKVLSTQQHLMAYALSNYSLNHAYVQYVKYAKEDTKLTEKQASKMSRLQTNKIDKLFDPKSFQEAKELGFYGIQCPKCGSWRTERRWNPDKSKDLMFCFDIHEDKEKDQWSTLKTMKLNEVIIHE